MLEIEWNAAGVSENGVEQGEAPGVEEKVNALDARRVKGLQGVIGPIAIGEHPHGVTLPLEQRYNLNRFKYVAEPLAGDAVNNVHSEKTRWRGNEREAIGERYGRASLQAGSAGESRVSKPFARRPHVRDGEVVVEMLHVIPHSDLQVRHAVTIRLGERLLGRPALPQDAVTGDEGAGSVGAMLTMREDGPW